jgi:hypothetical protein
MARVRQRAPVCAKTAFRQIGGVSANGKALKGAAFLTGCSENTGIAARAPRKEPVKAARL